MMNEKQMEGMSSEAQARKAIQHILTQIRSRPELAYYLGVCTQSFELLTEAGATLWDLPLEEVRENWTPVAARNPAQGLRELIEACERVKKEWEDDGHVSSATVRECGLAVKLARKGEDQ